MQSDELQDKISVEHFSECMKITRRELKLNPHVNFFPSSLSHFFVSAKAASWRRWLTLLLARGGGGGHQSGNCVTGVPLILLKGAKWVCLAKSVSL